MEFFITVNQRFKRRNKLIFISNDTDFRRNYCEFSRQRNSW